MQIRGPLTRRFRSLHISVLHSRIDSCSGPPLHKHLLFRVRL